MPADGLFGGQGLGRDAWLETAIAGGGRVALPDVQGVVRAASDLLDQFFGALVNRGGDHLAQRETPRAGEDAVHVEVERQVVVGGELEREEAGARIGKAKVGPAEGELGFERALGPLLTRGEQKRGPLVVRDAWASHYLPPTI